MKTLAKASLICLLEGHTLSSPSGLVSEHEQMCGPKLRMRYWMSVIYGHPVMAATRALRFSDHVTKRNGCSGDENGHTLSSPSGLVSEHEQMCGPKLRMRYWMSVIYGDPVMGATRALCFSDHVTKRNGGSGDENGDQAWSAILKKNRDCAERPEVRESWTVKLEPARALDPRPWPRGSQLWEREWLYQRCM